MFNKQAMSYPVSECTEHYCLGMQFLEKKNNLLLAFRLKDEMTFSFVLLQTSICLYPLALN